MEKQGCEVSIIIINYNSSEYSIKCVDNLLGNIPNAPSFELILVDNASKQEDYGILESYLAGLDDERIQLYRSRINTGFGGGNMHGVQYAQGKYYLFLNNDTLLLNDAVSICHAFMEETEDAAVCGAQIYNEKEEKQVSFDHFTSLGREVFGKKAMEVLFPKSKPDRKKRRSEPISVNYVNGSFMFFRASDFNAVGGFDTNIFLYFEESDICYRLKKKGKNTYFLPSASYLHYQGKSVDKTGVPMAVKIELKTSMFYVIRKNYGYLHYQVLRLFFALRYGLVSILRPKYFQLFLRILIGLPIGKSLKQKQLIQD